MHYISDVIDYVGVGNILSIVTFFIGIFISFYFYFKAFFRLVFTEERICEKCNNIEDWQNVDTVFQSRFLFYNNGRKTLTNEEVKNLEINSTGKIFKIQLLKDASNIAIKQRGNIIKINVKYLDSQDYFILEVVSKGQLSLTGRISETGKILNTEPKSWVLVNFIFILFCLVMSIYNLIEFSDSVDKTFMMFVINMAILAGIFATLRFIHKLFFIPDNLSQKYLQKKDKTWKQFKYNIEDKFLL